MKTEQESNQNPPESNQNPPENNQNPPENEVKKIFPVENEILILCEMPRSAREIATYFGYKDVKDFRKRYINPLIKKMSLKMTIPQQPNNRNQKYVRNEE